MAYVIQHLSLSPTSWYGGPLSRWVTSLGSAVSYADAASAQAVIDTYRMYAVPAVNPPGQIMLVNSPSSVGSGDVVAFADSTGLNLSDSARQPGTIRSVIALGSGAGTYTPVRTTGLLMVECVGAGGGGGGVPSPTGANIALGVGGGGGGFSRKFYPVPLQTFTYSVGAKGTGGAAGANNGTAGGNTTFTGSLGGTITAGGGSGGLQGAGNAAPTTSTVGAGGTATNGDLNIAGGRPRAAIGPATAVFLGSSGGNSIYGHGGPGSATAGANTTASGLVGAGYGAGGSGAAASGTGAAAAGGDGTDGIIIVTEFE